MYKVLIDYLNHGGRKRVPGELLDMSDEDAAPLIKIGAIEAVPEKSPDLVDDGGGSPDNNQTNGAGSDASKTGKKDSKTKTKAE
ncbi:MAG: hypothetical protein HRU77_06380 [Gammaproteobacteria bacterium]|jgi:hypothetical protein|nr:MAG: hypothetical protein HRU77_06380 [Gammaproteobacteria bacterium]